MFSHQITTSKYRTTIDIPAQKLHTRAKFLQIPKQSSNSNQYNQTFIIPSNDCSNKFQSYKKQQQYETKIMIEQLEIAYNDDIKEYQNKINVLKHQWDIEKIKFDNQNLMQKKQIENLLGKIKQTEIKQDNNKQILIRLEGQLKQKNNFILTLQSKITQLDQQIVNLNAQNKQKSTLLTVKLTDFRSTQDQLYRQQIQTLTQSYEDKLKQLSLSKSQLTNQISSLRQQFFTANKQNLSLSNNINLLEQQRKKLRQQIDFESKQIQSYLNKIKQLQKDILVHKQIHSKQDHQIESLLAELAKQRDFIESIQLNRRNQGQMIRRTENEDILTDKIIDVQNKLLEKQTLYLLKLKEIDQIRVKYKFLQSQINLISQQRDKLKDQIKVLNINYQKISVQLSKKILEYNQLLQRPLQQKVYEVKIEKTIDKKDYILKLEHKVKQLEHYIEQLRANVQGYIVQLKNRDIKERQWIQKNLLLQKQIQELRRYIQKRQHSVSWVVEREIVKDVEISQNSQSKSKSYKVYVKKSHHQEQQQISAIKKEQQQNNISVGSKIDTLLHHENQYKVEKYQVNLGLSQKANYLQQ